MSNSSDRSESVKEVSQVISIDNGKVKSFLAEIVRDTVESTLNDLLDAEADVLCGAMRYERSENRIDGRAGHYGRKLHTKAGEVNLKIPKLRTLPFDTAIIERYKRRESSVDEALIEMYLAGVSTRRVESITEALWGTRVSPGTISNLNNKVYTRLEKWRNKLIENEHPYVYLDGIWLKRSWGGEVKNVSILVAIGVNDCGYREILGVCEGSKEDKASWLSFLRSLKSRGLSGVRLMISDKCLGLVESIGEVFPEALWQRCMVHFQRNVLSVVPRKQMKEVSAMVKAIYASEDMKAALEKSKLVAEKLKKLKLSRAVRTIEDGIIETLSFYSFPSEHWKYVRTNNPLERLNREIRRRTQVVGNFPDGRSALMLVTARLKHIADTKWGSRKYLNMDRLIEQDHEKQIQGVA